MNRFRSRKKSFHDGSAEPSRRPSVESDIPALPIFSSKTFRRNKKSQPQSKPQLDLTTALPSSDDFRTSLLMPNLSARFSMLREQDDPHSKLGKANDDSVLFPKRASRLDLFNNGSLRNISEDDPLHAPIRTPFASTRTDSCGSDGTSWTDDDRSIISRARPGEGNNMFGGRQKIYKIPIGASGSTKSFGTEDVQPRRGKALYGDDLAMSTFPKISDKDTYGNSSIDAERNGHNRSSDERSNSPPLTQYNRNRETASSTHSGPSAGRTSTAATSVASQRSVYGGHSSNGMPLTVTQGANHSQPSERPSQKPRRLYGQGLDQSMYEQQYTAMHRLESLHRQRANGPPPLARLHGSRSATSLNDRFQQSGPVYTSNEFRAASPPPSGSPPRMGDFDLDLPTEPSNHYGNLGRGRSPPLSPPMSPIQDNTFVASLEPNDLGKATASGAFNKPNKQYSEQQYLERQIQLQQGRESPSLVRPFSPSAASIDEQLQGRSRNASLVGSQAPVGVLPRQHEHVIRHNTDRNYSKNQHPSLRDCNDHDNHAMESSFLSNISNSEVGSPLDSDNEQDLFPPSASYQGPRRDFQATPQRDVSAKSLPKGNHHIALPEDSISDTRSEITVTEPHGHISAAKATENQDKDSPTLGSTAGLTSVNGLNGLVKAHLRNDSGQSSIYPEPSPSLLSNFPNNGHTSDHSRNHSTTEDAGTFFRQSTFEPESQSDNIRSMSQAKSSDVPPPLSLRARQILDQATALRNESPKAQQMLGHNKAQQILGGEAPRPSHDNAMIWQEQLRAHHNRGGSTETAKEREGLANELAERRRAVQDNLRSFVEHESRSSSPAPGSRPEDAVQKRTPFGMLKTKTSRESLAGKPEHSTKAMKMLGIGPNASRNNGSPQPLQDASSTRRPEAFRAQNQDRRQPQLEERLAHPHQRMPGRRTQDPQSMPESYDKHPSPANSRSSRERSSSEASERRFLSRNAKPRNNALIEEESNPASPTHSNRPRKTSDAPRPVEELMASMASHQGSDQFHPAMSSRSRSNSKTTTHGYFERETALPIQPNAPPMVSPSTPGYSIRSAPSLHDDSSMAMNESIPVMIPPSSSHSAYSSPRHYRNHRKESINKHDISEPIFKFGTSSVDVVDLPPGASLKNGMEPRPSDEPPPIPPLNPRRKRTQTLLQALGRVDHSHPVPHSRVRPAPPEQHQERSAFSGDEAEPNRKIRHRLRKSSSEGGNLNTKARQQAMMAESPAVPNFPENLSTTASPIVANFPLAKPHYQYASKDVPTGAVMF
ncbi:MAG: hypothetical protein Q9222_002425 [Ikaeria aurantiellina]